MDRLSLEVKVGLVVFFAIALVLAFLFVLGDYNPFSRTYQITVSLNYAGGIKPGSDVQLAGAKVGKVDSIRFVKTPAEDKPVMELILQIDRRAKELIREDSVFSIRMESLLGGKIVEIAPGSPEARVLKEEEVVRGQDPPQLEALIEDAVALVQGLKQMIAELSPEDRENLSRLLSTLSSLGPDDLAELRRLLTNAADASEDLKAIAGEARPELGPLLRKANLMLSDLQLTLNDAQSLFGDARGLMREARSLVGKLDRTVDELRGIMPEDPAAAQARVEELLETTEELARIIDRLDRFTARVETEFGEVTRTELERWLREFLQQEGITVNVGKIVGKPDYPPPPADPAKPEAKPAAP